MADGTDSSPTSRASSAASFASEGGAERPGDVPPDAEALEHAPHELDVPDVDLEALEPGGAERLDGHRDHLRIGLRLVETEQLDARLVELPHPAETRRLVPEDVRPVGQPVGFGPVAEAGGGDARDLGRHVGPKGEHPPGVPVDELEHPLLESLVRPQREHVEELERRGHHLAVSPQPEHAEETLLQAPEARGLVREVDLHPGGELRLEVPPVHWCVCPSGRANPRKYTGAAHRNPARVSRRLRRSRARHRRATRQALPHRRRPT